MNNNQIDHNMEQAEAVVEEYLKSIGLDFSAFENGDDETLKPANVHTLRTPRTGKIYTTRNDLLYTHRNEPKI